MLRAERPPLRAPLQTFDDLLAAHGYGMPDLDAPRGLSELVDLLAVCLWEESTVRISMPGRLAISQALDAFLLEHGVAHADPGAGALDDAVFAHVLETLRYGALVGYGLGRTEGLHEAARLAAAKAYAGHVDRGFTRPNAALVHDLVSWVADQLGVRPADAHDRLTAEIPSWRQVLGRADPSPAQPDADTIGAWLSEHALGDASPRDVVARLLEDPAALERLRSAERC